MHQPTSYAAVSYLVHTVAGPRAARPALIQVRIMSNVVVAFPLSKHVAIEAFARELHWHTRHVPAQRIDRIARACMVHRDEAVAHGIPVEAARAQSLTKGSGKSR